MCQRTVRRYIPAPSVSKTGDVPVFQIVGTVTGAAVGFAVG